VIFNPFSFTPKREPKFISQMHPFVESLPKALAFISSPASVSLYVRYDSTRNYLERKVQKDCSSFDRSECKQGTNIVPFSRHCVSATVLPSPLRLCELFPLNKEGKNYIYL
jgi:hypothetical protein